MKFYNLLEKANTLEEKYFITLAFMDLMGYEFIDLQKNHIDERYRIMKNDSSVFVKRSFFLFNLCDCDKDKLGHYSEFDFELNYKNKTKKELDNCRKYTCRIFDVELFEKALKILLGVSISSVIDIDEQEFWKRVDWYRDMKVILNQNMSVSALDDTHTSEEKEEHASKLTYDQLKKIAIEQSKRLSKKRTSSVTQTDRDEYIKKFSKERANGKCQLCGHDAPFLDRKGVPYLEVHHIVWFSRGGEDSVDNTVALCPNCHKKMHVLDDEKDVEFLKHVNQKLL
ncbi:MAG: HNH endonuclease [Lachnospiraceae bacterium]|nr:HNH endonuclease [Lachnospiraceae bacterium]